MEYSKFRVATGQLLLKGLFYETVNADKTGVVYTLKPQDHAGYPSLYRLFLESDDVTEYSFAVNYLDGWDHWERLCKCTWFKPFVAAWRKELEIRTRSRALKALADIANDPSKKESFQANKFLVTGSWKTPEESKGRGRPSKDEIKSEAERIARDSRDVDDDMARVTGSLQ